MTAQNSSKYFTAWYFHSGQSQVTESRDASAWLRAAIYSSQAREVIQGALYQHSTGGKERCGDIGE